MYICQSWSPNVSLISQHLCKDEMLGRVSYLCCVVEITHHSSWCLSSSCVVHGPFTPLKLLSILCSHETQGTVFSPNITWTLHSIQHWWAVFPYRNLFLSFSHSTLPQLSLILSSCFSQLKLKRWVLGRPCGAIPSWGLTTDVDLGHLALGNIHQVSTLPPSSHNTRWLNGKESACYTGD